MVKKKIIFTLLIVIVAIAIILIMTISSSSYLGSYKKCNKSTRGNSWNCNFKNSIFSYFAAKQQSKKCSESGGEWRCLGFRCSSGYSCIIPASDTGKECNGSNECQEQCLIEGDMLRLLEDKENKNEIIKGKCSKHSKSICGWNTFYTVESNEIVQHEGAICD